MLYDGFLKSSAAFMQVLNESLWELQLDVGRFSKLYLHVAAVC